jgi:RNA polymerase sigma-70 factor (ECF subfamily)
VRNLLEELVPRIYRLALRLTNDSHAAEDLTQETVLRAWRRRWLLRNPRAIRVWLFRITVNLWRDQLRKARSKVSRAGSLDDDLASRAPGPHQNAVEQEDLRRAFAAMQDLPARQQEVLYLNACEDLSAVEIAGILGISADSAKASLYLARKKLREQLKDVFQSIFLVL